MGSPTAKWFVHRVFVELTHIKVGRLFIAVVVLGWIAARSTAAGDEQAERPPNVVLIVADDLGWADLACYGGDLHETPNLDRLARQGIRFSDAYAAAPVCSPTRAAVMTGKHPARLHMTIWHEASANPPRNRPLIPPVTLGNLPHSETTLAEILQSAGYATAHVGKWHLGDSAHFPNNHGFDLNIGGTHWGAPPTFFYPYRGPFGRSKEPRYVPDLPFGKPGEYLTDRLTSESLAIIDRLHDRPFFLHLAFHSVHTPIEAKAETVNHFRGKLRDGLQHRNATYAAMVHHLDENVGRVMDRLDELDIAEETILLFTSDNGGYVNQYSGTRVTNNHPLRSGKGSLYEGGLRVPLIVRWPGVTPVGTTCREPVTSCDLLPTLIDAVSLAAGKDQAPDGVSLLPLLEDPDATLEREAVYFHYPHYYPTTTPVSALRVGHWKLLEYFEDQSVELYDLENDLGESRNLASAQPQRVRDLLQRLHRWRAEVGAQLPATNAKH